MKWLLSALVICAGLAVLIPSTSQTAYFIPIPSAFAPVTQFGCPSPGTIFTLDVTRSNSPLPNRLIATGQNELNCWVKSDSWGDYPWFSGVGLFGKDDIAERQAVADLWPLQVGKTVDASKYGIPSRYSEVEFAVAAYGFAVVPGGVFRAYKIRTNLYSKKELVHIRTIWWAPSLNGPYCNGRSNPACKRILEEPIGGSCQSRLNETGCAHGGPTLNNCVR